MNTYKGTSLLILDVDTLLPVGADLSKDASDTWSGTLTFPAEARTPELMNLATGALRISGRDGAFVRPDTSDWVGSPAGPFQIRIEGNGDAPF
jgi:hypothetical protein